MYQYLPTGNLLKLKLVKGTINLIKSFSYTKDDHSLRKTLECDFESPPNIREKMKSFSICPGKKQSKQMSFQHIN